MSKTIEIPDELYAQLEQQASMRGLALAQLLTELVREDEKARVTVAIERMRMKGLLLTPSSEPQPDPKDFAPIEVEGKPLSEVIIEDRG